MLRFYYCSILLLLSIYTISKIEFAECQQQPVNISQISCSFAGNSFCNWTTSIDRPSSAPPAKWEIKTTNTRNISITGPISVYHSTQFAQVVYTGLTPITATLTSPIIKPTTTYSCFIFDYYMFGDVPIMQLQLLNSSAITVFWERVQPYGDMFHVKYITIPPQNVNFQLKLIAKISTGAIAYVAPYALTTSCGKIMQYGGLLDFENGAIDSWSITGDSNAYTWRIKQAITSGIYDHTTNTRNGYLAETTPGGNVGNQASLVSSLHYYDGTYCLLFWFWRRIGSDLLEVTLDQTNPTNQTVLWSSANLQYPRSQWEIARVPIKILNKNKGTSIRIRATKMTSQQSAIDLDDILLKYGSCPTPITCNFNLNLCGWNHDMAANWIWDLGFGRVTRPQKLKFTAPPVDRSAPGSGMFLYSDFTDLTPGVSATAKLYSEIVKQTHTKKVCFTFYYLVRTMNTGSGFEVHLTDAQNNDLNTLWKYDKNKDYNSGKSIVNQQWLRVDLDIITQAKQFRFLLKVFTNNTSTFIAVDDIQIYKGACIASGYTTISKPTLPPAQPRDIYNSYNCNFEDKSQPICSWTTNVNSNWIVKSYKFDPNRKLLSGPKYDHTTRTSNGRYLQIMFQSKQTKGSAIITSPEITNLPNDYCFSFWYYSENLNYTIFIDFYQTSRPSIVYSIYKLPSTNTEGIWKPINVYVPNWGGKAIKLQVRLTLNESHGFLPGDNVALDDFKLNPGQCPNTLGDN